MTDLENYWLTIAKNEKGLLAYNSNAGVPGRYYFPDSWTGYIGGVNSFGITWDGTTKDNFKLIYNLESEETKNYFTKMKMLADEGVWSKNAASMKETSSQNFENGKSASADWTLDQIGNLVARVNIAHPEWKATIVDPVPNNRRFPAKFIQNGVAIAKQSKNPERALMFLDLLKWNPKYADLTWYGIEGKHWEAAGDLKYKTLPGSSNYSPGSNCPWGWRGPLERWDVSKPQAALDILNGWKAANSEYAYDVNFSFNVDKVKTELAGIQGLYTKYFIPALTGLIDYSKYMTKIEDDMKKVGVDKVLAELQAQMDVYKANNP